MGTALGKTDEELTGMPVAVKDLSVDQLRQVITEAVRQSMEDYLEDRVALQSESFKQSIEEAREDYRKGSVKPLEEFLDA
jgi:hypothetical protein